MPLAVPLSAALHAAVLFAAAQIGWSGTPLARNVHTPTVVWLETLPPIPAVPVEPLVEELEPYVEVPPSEEPPAETEREPEQQAVEPSPTDEAEAPAAEDFADEPAADAVPEPRVTTAPEPAPRAPVDWEAERRRAVVSVIEERSGDSYRSFSLDDLPQSERTEEPTPPTPVAEVMDDGCVIAKNRFQRMALMMLGRCVREARGDLFADAKPSYLEKLPVCVDTRESQAVAVESASGREYPTVKCRLVEADGR